MKVEQGRCLGDMWQWPVPRGKEGLQSGPALSGEWHGVSSDSLVVIT